MGFDNFSLAGCRQDSSALLLEAQFCARASPGAAVKAPAELLKSERWQFPSDSMLGFLPGVSFETCQQQLSISRCRDWICVQVSSR